MAFPRTPPPRPEHRLNEQIRVRQVRLIDETGAMLGVVPTDEARRIARERGFDLVEVSPDAAPPVCKLLDYGKFKYEQKKKTQSAKKKQHVQVLKEVRMRPLTEEHDLMTKVNHAREFLEQGDKVLFTVFFKGREQAHKEIGRAMMQRIKAELDDVGKVERDISMMGPRMQVTLIPKPGAKPRPPAAAADASKPAAPKPEETPAAAPDPAPEATKGDASVQAENK